MKHNLDLKKIPEIWETNEEKNLSVAELKKKYISFAHKRFICNPPISILNKTKNWQIEISRRVCRMAVKIQNKRTNFGYSIARLNDRKR